MNKATRIIVATLGTIFGISGMSHGFFEILQGNIPTGGLFISAIGEAQKMWPHGNEPAFTLIPNFLMTGIAAMIVGLAIIVWSLGFVHKKNGPTVFILLFVLLLLVGGGVAQILFFPWIWLVSTRINKPLALVAKDSTAQDSKATWQVVALVSDYQFSTACICSRNWHHWICTRRERSRGSFINYAILSWHGSGSSSIDLRFWICT